MESMSPIPNPVNANRDVSDEAVRERLKLFCVLPVGTLKEAMRFSLDLLRYRPVFIDAAPVNHAG